MSSNAQLDRPITFQDLLNMLEMQDGRQFSHVIKEYAAVSDSPNTPPTPTLEPTPGAASTAVSDSPGPSQWARELAAQAWCTPNTRHIAMHPTLCDAFAHVLDNFAADKCAESPTPFDELHGKFAGLVVSYTVDTNGALFSAGIDNGSVWSHQIRCCGATEAEATELRDYVMRAIEFYRANSGLADVSLTNEGNKAVEPVGNSDKFEVGAALKTIDETSFAPQVSDTVTETDETRNESRTEFEVGGTCDQGVITWIGPPDDAWIRAGRYFVTSSSDYIWLRAEQITNYKPPVLERAWRVVFGNGVEILTADTDYVSATKINPSISVKPVWITPRGE